MEVRKSINRHRIALRPAAAGQRRIDRRRHGLTALQPRCGQQRGHRPAARPAGMAIAADMAGPMGDGAIRPRAGLHPHQHGGRERPMPQLLGPAPQGAHRHAGHGPRAKGGIKRHIISAIMAVTTRPFGMHHSDGGLRQPQRLGQISAQIIGPLGVAPDRHRIAIPQRHRAAQAHRGMGDKGAVEFTGDGGGRGLATALHHTLLAGSLPQPILRILRQPGAGRPLRLQFFCSALGRIFGGGDDG